MLDLLKDVHFSYAQIALLSLFSLTFWLNRGKSSQFPPGPKGLPFMGCLPFIDKHSERTLTKWAKTYGPVLYIDLGSRHTVVLNSLEALQEAFVKQGHQFNGRYKTFLSEFASENGNGIFFVDDQEKWKVQRRFGLRALSRLSLHGHRLEDRIMEEADLLCNVIRSKNGKPFVLERDLSESVANVVMGVTINQRCTDQGNEALRQHVSRLVTRFRSHGMLYSALFTAPWIRHCPPFSAFFKQLKVEKGESDELLDSFIDEQEKKMDPENPSGFIEQFLAEMPKTTFTKQQLRVYLSDLLAAGTVTSTITIRWILLRLVKHQDVQRRIREEIDDVVGREGRVRYNCDIPYTKAVIQECFRTATTVPLTIPRRNYEEAEIMGYTIPRNTMVLGNLWAVHNDPQYWPNPQEFKPERHLDADGKFVKSDRVIPFSVGSRNCLGENLARMEVFLFVVSLLQKFEVLPNPDNPNPDMEGTPGPVNSPKHYPLIMKER